MKKSKIGLMGLGSLRIRISLVLWLLIPVGDEGEALDPIAAVQYLVTTT